MYTKHIDLTVLLDKNLLQSFTSISFQLFIEYGSTIWSFPSQKNVNIFGPQKKFFETFNIF